jgi:hypothetical protein
MASSLFKHVGVVRSPSLPILNPFPIVADAPCSASSSIQQAGATSPVRAPFDASFGGHLRQLLNLRTIKGPPFLAGYYCVSSSSLRILFPNEGGLRFNPKVTGDRDGLSGSSKKGEGEDSLDGHSDCTQIKII